ncbi:MAG TPA: response regulator transcription factor, partial [Puia sp.]|nr:response regulator transcription factor [Puia sp.]
MAINVCIVDDNKDIRSALEEIVSMSDGYNLSGSFSTAEDAIQKIPLLNPHVVLMDINLGEGDSGIDCVRKLKEQNPEILFMMCTVYEEDDKIFEALTAGANGYILKKTAASKLLDAIKELQEGGAPMSSQIARKVVAAFRNRSSSENNAVRKPLSVLSKRENEILELLAKGLMYKEIAANLFVGPETIRKH